jgi:hypothetical protein
MRAFAGALAVHVAAGVTAVVSGAVAASARKRPGRHPVAGRVYLAALGLVVLTAATMAVLRWPDDLHLLVIALVAAGLAGAGWRARRRRRPGWVRWHAIGLGGSYVALLTGFYVDNGPRLPLWELLPAWAFWVLPSVVGVPLVASALRRYRRGVSRRPARGAPPGAPPSRRGQAAAGSPWRRCRATRGRAARPARPRGA